MSSRIIAGAIDIACWLVCGTAPIAVASFLGWGGPSLFAPWSAGDVLLIISGFAAYGVWEAFWLARKGQTIGKYLEGIRVVRVDGTPGGFWRAVCLRHVLLRLVTVMADLAAGEFSDVPGLHLAELAGVMSLAASLDPFLVFLPGGRALHDYIAGTKVVVVHVNPKHKLASRAVFATCVVSGLVWFLVARGTDGLKSMAEACER